MRSLAPILLIGSALAGAAQAQDRTDVSQISTGPTLVAAPAEPKVPASLPPAQLSNDDDSGPAQVQLSSDDDSRPAQVQLTPVATSPQQPSQVAVRSKDPQAAEPISTPAEGRTAAIERVRGNDRCDPAEGKDKVSAECRKVIENRAAEYRRAPVTELSPEQKLLIDQQLRANADAAQQLARSGDPDNNVDAMGIASIVLTQNKEPKAPDKKQPDPQADAAVQAIIGVLQGGPPPQD